MTTWNVNDYALDRHDTLWQARTTDPSPNVTVLLWARTGSSRLHPTAVVEAEMGPLRPVTLIPRNDPHTIRLWLAVRRPDGAADTLYVKTIRTAHTPPATNGRVVLWGEDDAAGIAECKWWTDRAWHDPDGLYNIRLVPLWPNPTQDGIDHESQNLRSTGFPWHRAGGPTHTELLTGAGWTEWDGRP